MVSLNGGVSEGWFFMSMDVAPTYERIEWDRTRRAPAMEELFGRQYTPHAVLPDPEPLVKNLALGVMECLAGVRRPEQLGSWLMPSTFRELVRRHAVVSRSQTHARERSVRPTFALLAARHIQVADGVVEAVGIVSGGRRARAVALRLEAIDRRWRATVLDVL